VPQGELDPDAPVVVMVGVHEVGWWIQGVKAAGFGSELEDMDLEVHLPQQVDTKEAAIQVQYSLNGNWDRFGLNRLREWEMTMVRP